MNCSKCEMSMPQERAKLGYTICTKCSVEKRKVGHVIYPHKTGAFVQAVSSETAERLNKLDRRGYKRQTGFKNYKDVVKTEEIESKSRVNYRFKSNLEKFEDVMKKVVAYYNEWGYDMTMKFIKKLNIDGKIALLHRCKLEDAIVRMYMNPKEVDLIRKYNKIGV